MNVVVKYTEKENEGQLLGLTQEYLNMSYQTSNINVEYGIHTQQRNSE